MILILHISNNILDGHAYIEMFLHDRNTIPNASAAIFRKDAYLNVEKADEDVKFCADWLLWLKLLTIGNIAYSAEKLNYFRYHQKSAIATSGNDGRNLFIYKYDIYLRRKFVKQGKRI